MGPILFKTNVLRTSATATAAPTGDAAFDILAFHITNIQAPAGANINARVFFGSGANDDAFITEAAYRRVLAKLDAINKGTTVTID